MSQYFWNSALDEENHGFVEEYGEELLKLLAPKKGEQILDLGCSNGQLTEKIYQKSRACVQDIDLSDSSIRSAFVQGIDLSKSSIDTARETYHHIQFSEQNARNFQVEEPLDAVFSMDLLHLINQPDAVINCVEQALQPGGRFVAEFNGKGNVGAIVGELLSVVLSEIGCEELEALNPWYCPSIGEYAGLLERQGFDVRYAVLFNRPTPLWAGMVSWIETFAPEFLSGLSEDVRSQVINSVAERLRPALYRDRDGNWIADYWRIRVFAVKNS